MFDDQPGERMIQAIAAIFRHETDMDGELTAQALIGGMRHHPLTAAAIGQTDSAVADLLHISPIAEADEILHDHAYIPWGSSPLSVENAGEIARIYRVATLLGPNSPIFSDRFMLGFYYQQPDTYYPLHWHNASETYFILAGSADWTAGEKTTLRGPGEYIHHASKTPHAFHTGHQGLLALWRWAGDIDPASYTVLT